MTRLGSIARISFNEFKREGVTLRSPLEDQAVLVYRAASRFATVNGFEPYVHRGPNGSVRGRRGRIAMSWLVRSLFDGPEDDLRLSTGLILQVLRRTDAAVCLHNPHRGDMSKPANLPIWFIADMMPQNITVVAIGLSRKSADVATQAAHRFDEDRFLTTRERRLTEQEAGETQRPGEVTVTATETKSDALRRRDEAFEAARERRRAEHAAFVERVLEELLTSKQPLTATDILHYVQQDGHTRHTTTVRNALATLEAEGKIVRRKETKTEALVRGGGQMPKATRPDLFWPAPGPVPERTELPPGIGPQTPAAEYSEQAAEAKATAKRLVHDWIAHRRNPDGTRRNRSLNGTIDATGLPHAMVAEALDGLVREGAIVRRDTGQYYLASKVRRKDTVIPRYANGSKEQEAERTETEAETEDDQDLALVMSLARKLGVTLPSVRDQHEIARLKVERDNLQSRVDSLEDAVATLKKTVSVLSAG